MSWYNPKDARRCLPEGEYEAVVEKVVEHVAKESGNVGRKMSIRVYHNDTTVVLFDYLMAGEKAAWKIREFAKALGQVEAFDAGTFEPLDCQGCNVRVLLKIEDNGDFGEQNRVGKYLPTLSKTTAAPAPSPAPNMTPRPRATAHKALSEEDIPF